MRQVIAGFLAALFLPWVTPAVAQNLEALGIRVVERPGAASNLATPRAGLRTSGDALPDGGYAIGIHDIAGAWLIEPTRRYDHGVLGDAIEAGGLRVRLRDGGELDYSSPRPLPSAAPTAGSTWRASATSTVTVGSR